MSMRQVKHLAAIVRRRRDDLRVSTTTQSPFTPPGTRMMATVMMVGIVTMGRQLLLKKVLKKVLKADSGMPTQQTSMRMRLVVATAHPNQKTALKKEVVWKIRRENRMMC